jgi:hypothetical protein
MALQPINGPRLPPWINKARELFSAGVFFILMAVVAGYGHRVRRLMLNAKNQVRGFSLLEFSWQSGDPDPENLFVINEVCLDSAITKH